MRTCSLCYQFISGKDHRYYVLGKVTLSRVTGYLSVILINDMATGSYSLKPERMQKSKKLRNI
jgi:hypothetical protein